MSAADAPGPQAEPRPRRRPSRGAIVSLGLLLTLVGLFVLGGTIPTSPGTLERAAGLTGGGALAVWVGGILLGRSRLYS